MTEPAVTVEPAAAAAAADDDDDNDYDDDDDAVTDGVINQAHLQEAGVDAIKMEVKQEVEDDDDDDSLSDLYPGEWHSLLIVN